MKRAHPELSADDWRTIRRALSTLHQQIATSIRRAQRREAAGKGVRLRPSVLAMDAADVVDVWKRVRALHPPDAPAATDGAKS